jgi:pyruvate kinase
MTQHQADITFSALPEPAALLKILRQLRSRLLRFERSATAQLDTIDPARQPSARNLLHYLALRRQDLRALQVALAQWGLSSLGRAEPDVLASLDAVITALAALAGKRLAAEPIHLAGAARLQQHTEALFGRPPADRNARIMVTMPGEAAADGQLILDLLKNGMNCMRINCAHDGVEQWQKMLEHLRAARQATGLPCTVLMDLAGPKIRTGALSTRPGVIKIRPQRDYAGKVLEPARLALLAGTPESLSGSETAGLPALRVYSRFLRYLKPGQVIRLKDTRGARRTLTVVEVHPHHCIVHSEKTLYLANGVTLVTASSKPQRDVHHRLRSLPRVENTLQLQTGDRLVITPDTEPGHPAQHNRNGRVVHPAHIGCTCFAAFRQAKKGERVWFDDGKIGAVIERVSASQVQVRVTRTRASGGKLGSDKGINLPDSVLDLAALTAKDLADLPFVARHADMVALSFANTANDVVQLQRLLAEQTATPPAIVLKIETRRGFENLPDMLLAALRSHRCGVMIARGDLAVECGFERLAEVQEEILWLCEAAHVPVIWATQVLEQLAKEGLPSRAEISDVVLAQRAECVMLNKGSHILEAVRTLSDILIRMQRHQTKKRAMLRELHLADLFRPVSVVARMQ